MKELIEGIVVDAEVVLSGAKVKIKDLKDLLVIGSILTLDRIAGSPLLLKIQGEIVAEGEVVVLDENYGLRVTKVYSSVEKT